MTRERSSQPALNTCKYSPLNVSSCNFFLVNLFRTNIFFPFPPSSSLFLLSSSSLPR